MQQPTFTSLIPASAAVSAEDVIAALELPPSNGSERPHTIANFVSSVDGRAAFNGRSRAFGDPGDRALFHALRAHVDAVLAGTGTLRAENYGRIIPSAESRSARVAAGLAPEPLAVVITASGRVPTEIPLFAEPAARIVVFSPAAPDLGRVRANVQVEVLDCDPEALAAEAFRRLRIEHGVRTLLCEGGPTLFGALLRAGLVDELSLTLSPTLAGGDSGPSITAGPPLAHLAPLTLRGLLSLGETLYLRYAIAAEPLPPGRSGTPA